MRDLANDVIKTVFAPKAYSRAEIEAIRKQCECHATRLVNIARGAEGAVRVTTQVAGNGCVFLKIEANHGHGPDHKSRR